MRIEEGDSNRPKIGFGLDLTKAKIIQQDHLNKAQDAKNHARQVAESNILSLNEFSLAPVADRKSQAQGQGESNRDIDAFKIAPD